MTENKTTVVAINVPNETARAVNLSLNDLTRFAPIINQLIMKARKVIIVVAVRGSNIDLNNKNSDFAEAIPIQTSKKPVNRLIAKPIVIMLLIDPLVFSIISD